MVIESDSITKEYAKEYLCIAAMIKKLIKDPARNIWNRFVLWPIYLGIAIIWSVFCLILLIQTKSVMLGVCLGALIIAVFFTLRFYLSYLKALKRILTKERHITYTFSPESIEYDDHDMRKITAKWDSFQCVRVLKHGVFFLPGDLSGMLLGLPIENLDSIKQFMKENNIKIKVVIG